MGQETSQHQPFTNCIVWRPTVRLGSTHHSCLFENEASKPFRIDLNSGPRHRKDRCLWRQGFLLVPQTPKHDPTANTKCLGPDVYGDMACTKFSDFFSPCRRGPFCIGPSDSNADAAVVLGGEGWNGFPPGDRGKKSNTRTWKSNVRRCSCCEAFF